MRLTEAEIKQGILHEDASVREAAMPHFAESFSPDVEVMPLVMQAIERYGPEDAFYLTYPISDLVQTEVSIDWAIRELKREDLRTSHRYFLTLSRLLGNADAQLLVPRSGEILGLPKLQKESIEAVQQQIEFLAWDADRCWRELEEIAHRAVADKNWEVDFDRASRIARALARNGAGYIDRTLELLSKTCADVDNDPFSYLEMFLTEMAGWMRLEAAAPILATRIRASVAPDLIWDETQEALARIAAPVTVPLVTDDWEHAEWDMKLFATGTLAKSHTEASVEKGLQLLAIEEAEELRSWLALALLDQFDSETIEPLCQVIREGSYDPSIVELKRPLTAVATFLDISTEELKHWKEQAEREHRQMLQRARRYERDSFFTAPPDRYPGQAPLTSTSNTSTSKVRQPASVYKLAPVVSPKKHVGRNDPCPCGSGKKFKNCCINKS